MPCVKAQRKRTPETVTGRDGVRGGRRAQSWDSTKREIPAFRPLPDSHPSNKQANEAEHYEDEEEEEEERRTTTAFHIRLNSSSAELHSCPPSRLASEVGWGFGRTGIGRQAGRGFVTK